MFKQDHSKVPVCGYCLLMSLLLGGVLGTAFGILIGTFLTKIQ